MKKYIADNGDVYVVEPRYINGYVVDVITDIRLNSLLHC